MNQAHIHLIVNHFPIILPFVGFVILAISFFLNQTSAKRIAYFVFIGAAIFSAISMATGEGAEEVVEHFPNVTEHLIHIHEEWAEKLAFLNYFIAALSIVAIFLSFKKKANPKLLVSAILVLSFGTIILAAKTGTSGGEVTHIEIRNDVKTSIPVESQIQQNETSEGQEKRAD